MVPHRQPGVQADQGCEGLHGPGCAAGGAGREGKDEFRDCLSSRYDDRESKDLEEQ